MYTVRCSLFVSSTFYIHNNFISVVLFQCLLILYYTVCSCPCAMFVQFPSSYSFFFFFGHFLSSKKYWILLLRCHTAFFLRERMNLFEPETQRVHFMSTIVFGWIAKNYHYSQFTAQWYSDMKIHVFLSHTRYKHFKTN